MSITGHVRPFPYHHHILTTVFSLTAVSGLLKQIIFALNQDAGSKSSVASKITKDWMRELQYNLTSSLNCHLSVAFEPNACSAIPPE
jgi:hypothetical protein